MVGGKIWLKKFSFQVGKANLQDSYLKTCPTEAISHEISVGETVGYYVLRYCSGGHSVMGVDVAKKCSLKFEKTFLENFKFVVASFLVRPMVF